MGANSKWRHDPERREAAAEAHAVWLEAGQRALALAMEADEALRELELWRDRDNDPVARMLDESRGYLFRAVARLHDATRGGAANEIYIGNMAAAGVPDRPNRSRPA